MKRVKYHVVPTGNGNWKVKREGASRADSIHEKKSDAIDRGKKLAKSASCGQIIIHDRGGKFRTEHTYGKDPFPPTPTRKILFPRTRSVIGAKRIKNAVQETMKESA